MFLFSTIYLHIYLQDDLILSLITQTKPLLRSLSVSPSLELTGVSTMLGLLFLNVFTAWKTSTTLCLLAISHTMLLAQRTPLRPPPFLYTQRQ